MSKYNSISLAVPAFGAQALNAAVVASVFTEESDRTVFVFDGSSPAVPADAELRRSLPGLGQTKTNYRCEGRTHLAYRRVDGTVGIATVITSVSLPSDCPAEIRDKALQRHIGLSGSDEFESLVVSGQL